MLRITIIFTLLILGLGTFVKVCAQDLDKNWILLQGIVLDANTKKPISNVHIKANNFKANLTNEDGKFSLYLYKSDLVIFSYIGYSNFVFSLNDTLMGNSFVAGIFLKTDTLSAGEVIVYPRLGDIRSEFRNVNINTSEKILNAKNNLERVTYQGLTSKEVLGNPASNYEVLRRKQVVVANELGGIPSDKILGINPLIFIPSAIYLLKNGLPQKPKPPPPHISEREINRIINRYLKTLR